MSGNPITSLVATVGRFTLGALGFLGGMGLILRDTVVHGLSGPVSKRPSDMRAFFTQAVRVGPRSLGIVCLVNFFVGMILALIGGNVLQILGVTQFVGDLMGLGIVLELAPLLTGIIMTGYIGAALTAEIATMVVSEEITALETMALNPMRFVVVPRMLAVFLMVPCVTLLGMVVGIFGGYLIATYVVDLAPNVYWEHVWGPLEARHIWRGLFKAGVFGVIIGAVGCYTGFKVTGGAEGVGRATTRSVVQIILAIIISDAILNYFLLYRL